MAAAVKKTIACFGATGGCVATALASALKTGHRCTALARSPEKLLNLLKADHGLSATVIKQNLVIFQGDAKDAVAVAKALVHPDDPDRLVEVVLSGLGAYPRLQCSLAQPLVLTDPTICETTMATFFAALSTLNPSSEKEKPLLIVVSTAGCGRSKEGIPWPVRLPYHYFLSSPLADKQRMEKLVLETSEKGDSSACPFRSFVVARPLVLTDGEVRGDEGIRVGWEWGVTKDGREQEPGPARNGYYISKKDVGTWIFEKAIVEGGWEGKCVYLTY